MTLHNTILNDLTGAMKARDSELVGVLRLIKAALLITSKESGTAELTDEEVIVVLAKEAKKRKESEKAFRDGDRADLAEIEAKELKIIQAYLPEQMSEEEIEKRVSQVIEGLDNPDFGIAMGAAMKEIGGKADGAVVKEVVQRLLS